MSDLPARISTLSQGRSTTLAGAQAGSMVEGTRKSWCWGADCIICGLSVKFGNQHVPPSYPTYLKSFITIWKVHVHALISLSRQFPPNKMVILWLLLLQHSSWSWSLNATYWPGMVVVMVVVPNKFISWSPNTYYFIMWLYLEIRAFNEIIKAKMRLYGWAFIYNEEITIQTTDNADWGTTMWRHSEKAVIRRPRRETCWQLALGLVASRTERKYISVLKAFQSVVCVMAGLAN